MEPSCWYRCYFLLWIYTMSLRFLLHSTISCGPQIKQNPIDSSLYFFILNIHLWVLFYRWRMVSEMTQDTNLFLMKTGTPYLMSIYLIYGLQRMKWKRKQKLKEMSWYVSSTALRKFSYPHRLFNILEIYIQWLFFQNQFEQCLYGLTFILHFVLHITNICRNIHRFFGYL